MYFCLWFRRMSPVYLYCEKEEAAKDHRNQPVQKNKN